jgi:hypothetical protein
MYCCPAQASVTAENVGITKDKKPSIVVDYGVSDIPAARIIRDEIRRASARRENPLEKNMSLEMGLNKYTEYKQGQRRFTVLSTSKAKAALLCSEQAGPRQVNCAGSTIDLMTGLLKLLQFKISTKTKCRSNCTTRQMDAAGLTRTV